MARTLFVSDVHLRPRDPGGNRPFLRFLEQDCEALYVVGDLFDYWIGPRQLETGDYDAEIQALRRKSAAARIFFIKGNRDYLVEERFARATGMSILGDRARVDLGGRTLMLAHGDFVYNRNPKYTAYRTLMRSKPIEALWLQVPAFVGRMLVRGYRRVSPMTTRGVTWTPEALAAGARPFFERGADVAVIGHIHQPQHVASDVAGRRRDLYILGDWCGGTQDYLEWDGAALKFLRWT
jgi:UDP-2,3-diacylglucosamine hydrolase